MVFHATVALVSAPVGLSRLRRFIRPLVWAALALALYAGLGFIVAPLLALHYAPRVLGDLLGREVSIGMAGFNPFALSAELRGVKIMQAGGSEAGPPAVELDRLAVNFEISSLWRGGPVVRELALEGPRIRFVRFDAGRYDFSDVFDRFAGKPQAEDDEPFRFSIANIHVDDGLIELDDRVAGTKHRLSGVKLGLPFISNLPVTVDVFIEPDLSARLDDHPLNAKGRLMPFSASSRNELNLSLTDFDLPPWLVYLPFEPTFRLPSGRLSLDLHLEFEQGKDDAPAIRLQGEARVDDLAIQDRAGRPVLAVSELEAEFADVQPLRGRYYLSRLRLRQPVLDLVRLADGSVNLSRLLPASAPGTLPKKKNAKKNTGMPLDFLLSAARIRDGLIRYNDNAVKGGFSTRVEAINLDLRDLATGSDVPAAIRLDYTSAAGEKFSHQDSLRLKAPFEYTGNLVVERLQPALYGRYLAQALPGGDIRHGRADGVFHYLVQASEGGAPRVEIGVEKLTLADFAFALAGRKGELLKLRNLTLSDTAILPGIRRIRVGNVNANNISLAVTRLDNGEFDFMSLAGKPTSARAAEPPWTFQLDAAAVSDASLRFEDRAAGAPVLLNADDIELQLSGLSTAKGAKAASLVLHGRIGKDSRLALKGTLAPEPLRADLNVDLQAISLALAQPYVARQTRIGIKEGRLSAKGWLALRERRGGVSGSLGGNVSVSNFASTDHNDNADFMRWREVALKQARVDLEPFALAIGEVAIDGLQSRLILDEQGRLNVREIQRSSAEAGSDAVTEASAEASVNAPTGESAGSAAPSWPPVSVQRISIRNSNIAFSDHFIRPNYNAFLGNLSGELLGLSSDQATLAKLDLQGKVGRTAPLTIKGEFNPFRQDRHLDIAAEVKDFDLPALSGYSGRYVGYGISRGKLSATLNYRVEDRKLSAENHVFLDQITFGDAIDSPDATHLPVRLAVALLKNTRGEIDFNLPVSGTLDDPQFSVFGLVLRAIAGLIGKAVTAPFALLGREELSQVDFDPGNSRIGAEQEKKLRDLAKTLEERPVLKLDITGFADAGRDAEGIRREKLRAMVMGGKRKTMGAIEPGDEEYAALLRQAYDDAKIRKPRNFIGLAKSLPVAEMEKLLLEGIAASGEDIAALARRRESAVQRWLAGEGRIAPERLFQRTPTDGEIKESAGQCGVRFSLR
ncbi:MAG: DUF748 domain-containing protein [Azoarcus sp.]|nr:DUF748 domain-containing protein [Azoarcus sp.]